MKGPYYAILIVLVILVATIAFATSGSDPKPQACVIVFMSGQKLCGDDARTWCDMTDAARGEAEFYGYDESAARQACAAVRAH